MPPPARSAEAFDTIQVLKHLNYASFSAFIYMYNLKLHYKKSARICSEFAPCSKMSK